MTSPLLVRSADRLSPVQRADLLRLCTEAYDEDFSDWFGQFSESTHVLAYVDGQLVSHAAWVTRWLQPAGGPLLRTAYVEAVATAPAFQGRGLATAVLRELRTHLDAYDLGGLSPSEPAFYERLGWKPWRGPLAIRTETGLLPTPDEEVMILRLPQTPELNLDGLLTAEWRVGELW
jgi:aminoglycoside 2'-N-acetyltransferase I